MIIRIIKKVIIPSIIVCGMLIFVINMWEWITISPYDACKIHIKNYSSDVLRKKEYVDYIVFSIRGEWATATKYKVKDNLTIDSLELCCIEHTPDIIFQNWQKNTIQDNIFIQLRNNMIPNYHPNFNKRFSIEISDILFSQNNYHAYLIDENMNTLFIFSTDNNLYILESNLFICFP